MPKEVRASKEGWVLIIEDDASIDKAYSAKFTHEGIKVKIAEDGEQAMAMLQKGELPGLILLDLMLPKKSGFEVLKEVKESPRLKDIPVLILTNLAQELDADRGLTLGAVEYLVKADVKIEDIVNKVRKYLQKPK
jgi:DNA-binding response OmpR family regulator